MNVFVNFWLFCNGQYEATSDLLDMVADMAKAGKSLSRERNQNLKEIDELKQKTASDNIHMEQVYERMESSTYNIMFTTLRLCYF